MDGCKCHKTQEDGGDLKRKEETHEIEEDMNQPSRTVASGNTVGWMGKKRHRAMKRG